MPAGSARRRAPSRASATHPAEQGGRPSWRRAPRRPVWARVARGAAWLVGAVAVAAVLLVFVFPTRTYLDQRRQLAATSRQLHVLDQQNAQLAARVERLHSDAEIVRLAREQYHLVRPGEQAFAILPAPAPASPAPAPVRPASRHTGLWGRLSAWW